MKLRCPRCNHPHDETLDPCAACGRPLPPLPVTKTSPKKRKAKKTAKKRKAGNHHANGPRVLGAREELGD